MSQHVLRLTLLLTLVGATASAQTTEEPENAQALVGQLEESVLTPTLQELKKRIAAGDDLADLEGEVERFWHKLVEGAASLKRVESTSAVARTVAPGQINSPRDVLDYVLLAELESRVGGLNARLAEGGVDDSVEERLDGLAQRLAQRLGGMDPSASAAARKVFDSVVERLGVLLVLRARLVQRLAAELSGDATQRDAYALVDSAVSVDTERRRNELFGEIKCDCKREKWTRTLAGCWEACVNGQRKLVEVWLGVGLSNSEVLQWMREYAGTDKVLVGDPGFLARLSGFLPYVLFLAAAGLVFVVLRGLLQRRERAQELATVPERLDVEWEMRLERELKSLEETEE